MRLLLDAHAVIWAMDDPVKLGVAAAAELRNPLNDLLVGAGTIWEIAIKVGKGKLQLSMSYRSWMDGAILHLGLSILPITVDHADVQVGLLPHHGDPFDRLLVAQALHEQVPLISADAQLDAYGLRRIW